MMTESYHLTPIIALVDTIDINVSSYEFRRRGYVVEKISLHTKTKKHVFLLTLSRKLIDKITIIKDIPVSNDGKYEISQQSAILNEAIEILSRSAAMGIDSAWICQDKRNLTTIISATSTAERVSLLCGYYGPQIGLYFGWLNNYTVWLLLPSFAGMITFYHQYLTNTIDSTFMPYFAIFVCIWGTCFLEFSRRKCAELSFRWHSFGIEDVEIEKELAKSISDDNPTQPFRLALSFCCTAFLIMVMLYLMLHYMHENAHAEEIYGVDSLWKHYPMFINSLLPLISPIIFDPIARFLNELEAHSTKAEAENYLILKKFPLQFVNRYSGLLYLTFWKRDLAKVRELLFLSLFFGAIINNAIELFPPYLRQISKFINEKRSPQEPVTNSVAISIPDASNCTTISDKDAIKIIEDELSYQDYDIDEDYLEMVIQFGYVTMFAVAFPLTPIFAIVNNYFEFYVDFRKLSNCQRPKFVYRSSIGSWQTCLQIISFVSILTNCFMLAIVSEKLHVLVPIQSYHFLFDTEYGRLVAMWILEHILLGIKLTLMSVIPDIPRNIRIYQAKQAVEIHERNLKNKLKLALPSSTSGDNEDASARENSNAVSTNATNTAATNAIASSLLQQELSHTIGYNPIALTSLFLAPMALQTADISPWFYVPLSILFLSYLQAEKDRSDRKAAIGIVTNTNVLRLVEEELPSWIRDSEFQRLEWFNTILQQLWPHLSLAIDTTVKEKLQPILNAKLPPILSELTIKSCSLGTISPKIIGIRILTSSESNIRFDIEIRWAGDPLFELRAGLHLFPINVSVSEIRLSTVIRVEILDFVSTLPCFQAISITCMKKPHLDFSLKIAKVDIMNLGAANYNLPTLLRHVIHCALTETALYPKKILIPIGKTTVDKNNLSAAVPVGMLHLKIIKGMNLLAVNIFGGSDPYVSISSAEQTFRTTTKKLNLNPVWNEDFQLLIYDKETQEVECMVYDYDVARKNSFLGRFTVLLSKLQPHQLITKTFDLADISTGKVVVSCKYIPLMKRATASAKSRPGMSRQTSMKGGMNDLSQSADILYDFNMDDLNSNEMLMKENVGDLGSSMDWNVAIQNTKNSLLPQLPSLPPLPPLPSSPSIRNPGQISPFGTRQSDTEAISPLSDDVSVASYSSSNHQPIRSHSQSDRRNSFLSLFGAPAAPIPENGQGVLCISGLKLRNLQITATNKIFISVKLNGNKSFHTKTMKQMKDPLFPDQFNLLIGSIADGVITIRVMIPHKITSPTMIADKIIAVRDLIEEDGGDCVQNEQEFMLNGEVQEAFVGFRVHWNCYEHS